MRYLELVADRLGEGAGRLRHLRRRDRRCSSWAVAAIVGLAWALHRRWRPPRPAWSWRPRDVPALRVVHGARRGPPDGSRRSVLRRRSGRCSARHVAGRRDGPGRRRPGRRAGRHGARGARRQAAGRDRGDPPARRPHHRAAGRARRVPVGLVLEPGCPETSAIQADLDTAIADEHVPVRHPRAGDTVTRSATFVSTFFLPTAAGSGRTPTRTTTRSSSCCTTARTPCCSGGEPEQPAQQVLLDAQAPLHAELLKVPHHGAATSLPEFFQAVDADLAVISVGQPNDYGHPVQSTLDAIRRPVPRSGAPTSTATSS